jgi:hypothetical protein
VGRRAPHLCTTPIIGHIIHYQHIFCVMDGNELNVRAYIWIPEMV